MKFFFSKTIFFKKAIVFKKESYKQVTNRFLKKRSFSVMVVIYFLKVQNEWVVFKNGSFFSKNETIVFEND